MEFNIENIPVQKILYMRRVGPYGEDNNILMEEFKNWVREKGVFEKSIIYGIAHDNEETPKDKCRYDVCLLVDDYSMADEAVSKGEIVGGGYAIFNILHTKEAVVEFWNTFINTISDNKLSFDMTRPILERYEYNEVKAGRCEFCIPII